ncbi:MAG: hypothetical protein RIS24_2580 [Verrucomicrobiota bacterium]
MVRNGAIIQHLSLQSRGDCSLNQGFGFFENLILSPRTFAIDGDLISAMVNWKLNEY